MPLALSGHKATVLAGSGDTELPETSASLAGSNDAWLFDVSAALAGSFHGGLPNMSSACPKVGERPCSSDASPRQSAVACPRTGLRDLSANLTGHSDSVLPDMSANWAGSGDERLSDVSAAMADSNDGELPDSSAACADERLEDSAQMDGNALLEDCKETVDQLWPECSWGSCFGRAFL